MALYHRRCCPAIADVLKREGERKITNFYKKIKVRHFSEVEWRAIDPGGLSFRNANTPEDLAAIDGSP
jgi:molybdopterin-guanine dinucleotide biosynthesis protein A